MFPALLVLALTIGLAAAAGQARANEPTPPETPPPPPKPVPKNLPALIRGLTPEYVTLARKYAKLRSLPVDWVLTTIIVESGGHANESGDTGGISKGLMQVNSVAHADLLKKLGLTPESLFNPEINIAIGTWLMRQFLNEILAALKTHPSKAPVDEILRLYYKGPKYVMAALQAGRDPRTLPWAPPSIANWQKVKAATQALV